MATIAMPIITIRKPVRHGLPTSPPKVKPVRNSMPTAMALENLKASRTSSIKRNGTATGNRHRKTSRKTPRAAR